MTVKTRLQLRHDTAANWTSANPTLRAGETGWETDTGRGKVGDGSTAWNSLPYANNVYTADESTVHLSGGQFSIHSGGVANAQVAASAGIALSKLATQADQTFVGNTSGGTAVPTSITRAQAEAMLGIPSLVGVRLSDHLDGTTPTDLGIAWQNCYDALTAGGGSIIHDVAGTYTTRVWYDRADVVGQVNDVFLGKAMKATIADSVGKVTNVTIANSGSPSRGSYVDNAANQADVGCLIAGSQWPIGTLVSSVSGTYPNITVHASKAATTTGASQSFRIQRALRYVNLARPSVGTPLSTDGAQVVTSGGVTCPAVVDWNPSIALQTAGDNDTTVMWTLCARLNVASYHANADSVYRAYKSDLDYTDKTIHIGADYKNEPHSWKGSGWLASQGGDVTQEDIGNGWFYEQANSGDGVFLSAGKGGGAGPMWKLNATRGGTIEAGIVTAMRLVAVDSINIVADHWDSNQPGGANPAGMSCHIYLSNARNIRYHGWWHAGPHKSSDFFSRMCIYIDDSNGANEVGTSLDVVGQPSWRYDNTGGAGTEDHRFCDINYGPNCHNVTVNVDVHPYAFKQASGGSNDKSAIAIWHGSYDRNNAAVLTAVNTAYTNAAGIVAGPHTLRIALVGAIVQTLQCTITPRSGMYYEPAIGASSPAISASDSYSGSPSTSSTLMSGATPATDLHYMAAVKQTTGAYSQATADLHLVSNAINKVQEVWFDANQDGTHLVCLWRNTVTIDGTHHPDRYVLLPHAGGQTMFRDSGGRVNGIPWITSSVPDPTVVAAADHTRSIVTLPGGHRIAYGAVPTTAYDGTWAVGDQMITAAGGVHVCTAAGTPGTWT